MSYKILRRICILDHPIPGTENCTSCQIILPQDQIGRKYDIYILVLGNGHCVSKKGYYLVFLSTVDDNSEIQFQLQSAMDIIGNVSEFFDKVDYYYEPIDKDFDKDIYITNSFCAQSFFEDDFKDVVDIFHKITGNKLHFFIPD